MGCILSKLDVNMMVTCVFVKKSALKRFISRLKICIKRETALPRLQGLKKKLLICGNLKIGLESVGAVKMINFFCCTLHFKFGNDASKFDLA